jgi:succinate-semialdehyde dehydrogenase/glutarate-semialdehyde dehydrogenase
MNTQISEKIEKAHASYKSWKKTSLAQRADLMMCLASALRGDTNRYAELMAQEMGKPVAQGCLEIDKCAWVCEYYAQHAADFLAPRTVLSSLHNSQVCYEPLGVVLGIMPWNYPFWQVLRFVVPTLMVGNVALLKHASSVSGCALAIEALMLQVGFPLDVLQVLTIDPDEVSYVIAHPHVIGVTFTGSEPVGRKVASMAGESLKRCVLELGGHDAYVVLDDADLAHAAACLVASRLSNAGQVCIAPKRIMISRHRLDKFLVHVQSCMQGYVAGDPLNLTTTLGPMVSLEARETLHQQVMTSVRLGATLKLGGHVPAGLGCYYPPTLLLHVAPGMPAFDEELFGPVVALVDVDDEAQAIAYANLTQYGLGGGVFTRDIARGEMLARSVLEAGMCVVNGCVSSDPNLPFGGIKNSGFGRELSREGLLEFVNVKTIGVDVS